MKEFIGTAALNTIGVVIAGIDDTLLQSMHYNTGFHSIGVLSSRVGCIGQFLAMDEAVKMTNTQVISVEIPLDAMTWGGHGSYIVIGADTPEDCRRAVEIGLKLTDKYVGEVYTNKAGHLELGYSAQAGAVLEKGLDAEIGRAYGFMAGSPAGIGLVMADKALKAAPISLIWEMSPHYGNTHFSNEVMISFKGDAGSVREAVRAGRKAGIYLLGQLGDGVVSSSEPYLESDAALD